MFCEVIILIDQRIFDDMECQDSFQYYRDVEIVIKEGENMFFFFFNLSVLQVIFVYVVNVL